MTGGSSEQHQLRSVLIFPTTEGVRHSLLLPDSIETLYATSTLVRRDVGGQSPNWALKQTKLGFMLS